MYVYPESHTYPFVVISGIIGAGKSTLTKVMTTRLHEMEYPCEAHFEHVKDNPYLGNFYDKISRFYQMKLDPERFSSLEKQLITSEANHIAFAIQLHFLRKRYHDHKRVQYNLDVKASIQDRSIFEDVIFVNMLHRDHVITDLDKQEYYHLFRLMSYHFIMPNYIIYLHVNPETAMERIRKRSRNEEVTITLQYLKALQKEYERFIDEMSKFTKVDIVDWNEDHQDIQFLIDRMISKEYFKR
jgi:deoxyadenosine/deoxycytidine kinase